MSNRVDAAILEDVYQSLSRAYPGADITVMTEHPRAAELVHRINAEKQVLASFQWSVSKENAAKAYLSLISALSGRDAKLPRFEYVKERGNIEPYLGADRSFRPAVSFYQTYTFLKGPCPLGTLLS